MFSVLVKKINTRVFVQSKVYYIFKQNQDNLRITFVYSFCIYMVDSLVK